MDEQLTSTDAEMNGAECRLTSSGRQRPAILISFDIDGTLACGDPPGAITFHMVRRARQLGCIVGTGSDRPTSHQRAMFAAEGLDLDFVGHKHLLHEARSRFRADHYLHIGDTEDDRFYAERAGFRFLHVGEFDGDIARLVRSIADSPRPPAT